MNPTTSSASGSWRHGCNDDETLGVDEPVFSERADMLHPSLVKALSARKAEGSIRERVKWTLKRLQKLPHDERVRLAKLALRAAAHDDSSAAAYAATPPGPEEFSSDDEPLAWEGLGWEEFGAPR